MVDVLNNDGVVEGLIKFSLFLTKDVDGHVLDCKKVKKGTCELLR